MKKKTNIQLQIRLKCSFQTKPERVCVLKTTGKQLFLEKTQHSAD